MKRKIGHDIIPYPRYEEVLQEIDDLRLDGYMATHTEAQLLRGPSGVGKSAIVKKYAHVHQAKPTDDGWSRPVVVATAGKGLTKPLAEALLFALGDDAPSRGTENEMIWRAEGHLREQGTQLVIFDEVQDAMRGDLHEQADFYKRVLNFEICPVLLVGAPHSIELLRANEYLRGRSRPTIDIDGFNWFDPYQKKIFRRILKTIQDRMLQNGITSVDLDSDPVASRLSFATWGTMRRLVRLLAHAERLAAKTEAREIDQDVLAAAYQAFANQERDDVPPRINPFTKGQGTPAQWNPLKCDG